MIGTKPTTQRNGRQAGRASVYGTEGYWFEPSGVYFGSYFRIVGGLCTDGKLEGSEMLPTNKKLISTSEAAAIFGCTMGRIRQLARAKELWSAHLSASALVYDFDEVKKKAKEKASTGRPRKYA